MARRVWLSLPCLLAFSACSLTNKFDPLRAVQGSAGKSSGGSSSGGASGAGTTGGARTGGNGGTIATGGTGGSGGAPSTPPGLVVVVNKAGTTGFLSVLSPQTGGELSREKGAFLGLARDDANDLWYVLTDDLGNVLPDTTDPVSLQARKFDRAKNAWTKLGTPLKVPVPVGPLEIGLLIKRLAILTYALPTDAGPSSTKQLTVVDTSNPSALKIANLTSFPSGFVDIDQDTTRLITSFGGTAPGGQITLVRRSQTLDITLRRFVVAQDDVIPGATSSSIGTLPANNAGEGSAWDPDPNNSVVIIAMPVDQQNAVIRQLSLIDYSSSVGTDPTLTLSSPVANQLVFAPPAVDICTSTAFVAELRDTHSVFAIPLGGSGTVARRDLGHSGQQVAFEPYTRSVLAAYTSGNASGISAYTLGGSATSPSLAARTDWNPPGDLKPASVVVARPVTENCK